MALRACAVEMLKAGPDMAEELAAAAAAWIRTHVRPDYAWRGNMRELQQCVHNILTHRHYELDGEPDAPVAASAESQDTEDLLAGVRNCTLGGDQLLEAYCARVYAREGTYEKAAEVLDMGWRRGRDYVQAWRKRTRGGAED